MADKPKCCSSEDIQKIIDSKRIATLFQPVVSIEKKNIVGFEAFSRGRLEDDVVLAPEAMFEGDLTPEVLSHLDGVCCSSSLARFQKFLKGHQSLCLFLNVDGRVLDHVNLPKHFLTAATRESKVPPGNIAVEISALHMGGKLLPDFLHMCRDDGFLLSVDRVGRDVPVLDVLFKARPHFMKLDHSLWGDAEDPLYNKDNLMLIGRACRSVGCQPIALGVESEEQALYLLECGLVMHQGYYYTSGRHKAEAKAAETGSAKADGAAQAGPESREEAKEEGGVSGFLKTVEHVYALFTEMKRKNIAGKKERFDRRHKAMQRMSSKFAALQPQDFEPAMKAVMEDAEGVVSMFILDEAGVQITERLPRGKELRSPRTIPAIRTKGQDHSMMDYHLYLQMGYERFVNPPLGSPFLDRQTTTVALRFFTELRRYYVLCIEYEDE